MTHSTQDELALLLRQQGAVAELGMFALIGATLQDLIEEAARVVSRVLEVPVCHVLRSDGRSFSLLAGVGWSPGAGGSAIVKRGPDSFADFVLRADAPVIVRNLHEETRFGRDPILESQGAVSSVGVAILGHDKPFGVLGAHAMSVREFTAGDANFLQSVANILSEAVRRAHSDECLRENLETLQLALKFSQTGVFSWDLVTGTVAWDDHVHGIFGISREDFAGTREAWVARIHPDDRPLVAESAERARDEHDYYWIRYRIVRGDDTERFISVRGRYQYDPDGRPLRMTGIVRDVTVEIQAEESARKLAVMGQREDFMATLTHDLKNPLIAADRLLNLIVGGELGELSEEQVKLLSQLKESNQGLIALIQHLAEVLRYEADIQTRPLEKVNLASIVTRCVEDVLPLADSKEIELESRVPASVKMIKADRRSMVRVVQNLLDNAVKFTRPGGRITVELSSTNGEVSLTVKDTGPGIPEDEQRLLFRRFWQGRAGKKYPPGTGLGLYLCQQIVDAHRGKIACDSQEDEGATFIVVLPAADEET